MSPIQEERFREAVAMKVVPLTDLVNAINKALCDACQSMDYLEYKAAARYALLASDLARDLVAERSNLEIQLQLSIESAQRRAR